MRESFFSWLSNFRLVNYGASALIFDPQGRLLLVKHRLRGGWEWPAGGARWGELPHQTVVREAGEEVGLHLSNPRLVGVYARGGGWLAARLNFTFAANVTETQAAAVRLSRLELTDMRWIDPEAARQLITPRLRERLERFLEAQAKGTVAYISVQK